MRARTPPALLALVAALAGAACSRIQPVDDDGAGAALMRNLRAAGTVDVIVRDGPIEERCAVLARAASVPALRVVDVPDESRSEHARVVIGTAADPLAAILVAAVGVELPRPGCFRVLGQHFEDPGDTLIATFEDPARPGLPLTVFFGNDARELAHDVREPLAGWRPELVVLHRGEPALVVPLLRGGRARVDRVVRPAVERARLRRTYVAIPPNAPSFVGSMSSAVEPARALAYMDACANAASRTAAWSSPSDTPYACPLVLHARLEDFETWTGARSLARLDAHERGIHALLAPGACDDAGAEMALLTAVRALGEPVDTWLSDAARYSGADAYLGRDLESWIGWLAFAELALPARTLVDAQAERAHSPHLVRPLRAGLWRALIATRGEGYVRQLWSGTQLLECDAELEAAFREWLAARALRESTAHQRARAARTLPAWTVALAVEEPAWTEDEGYGTSACAASLAVAKERGATAVSLASAAIAALDAPARAGTGVPPSLAAREGDVELLVAAAQARASGLSTWLSPQLLSGAAGTWSGSWLRGGEDEWQRFFASYRAFAIHYALLAELGGFDVLSLGTGLAETTRLIAFGRRAQPAEVGWKRAGWESVIRAARAGYAGQLTFVAASDDEIADIGFWGALDLVAIEPRVRFQSQAFATHERSLTGGMEALRRTWDAGAKKARENGKSLVVAGASFERTDSASTPRIGPGSVPDESRAEPFRRLVQLVQGSRDVLRGVAIGRWSTSLADPGLGPHDHLLADDAFTAELLRELRAAAETH